MINIAYFRSIVENLEKLAADLKQAYEKKLPPHILHKKKTMQNKLLNLKVKVSEFGRKLAE